MDKWYIWTIVPQRYKHILSFLYNLDEISEVFYPTVAKEYKTKHGIKIKNVPLFNNYIFIKYHRTNNIDDVISSNPWIKKFLGECSKQEMNNVLSLSNKKYDELKRISNKDIIKGHRYKLNGTPFRDMVCTVIDIDDDVLTVSIKLFGSDRIMKCSRDDVDLEG